MAFQSPYLYFTLFSLFILLVSTYYFLRKSSAAFAQLRKKWNPPAPYDPRLLRFDLNAAAFRSIFVVIGAVLFCLALYLSRYQYVGEKAIPAGETSYQKAEIVFRSMDGKQVAARVQGQKAAAAGIFLRFPKSFRYIGLGTYHKLITFRGFKDNQYHYNPPPAEWLDEHADWFFVFCYKNRKWLKIPEAVYAESPYFSPGKKHQIFVTRSGYIVN